MREPDIFDWTYRLLLYSLVGWLFFVQIRFVLKRLSSRHWPTTRATIQKGALGQIAYRYGAGPSASFFGYEYVVQDMRYAGLFALYGSDGLTRELQNKLAGESLEVRYNPANPNSSYLVDLHDSRFEGLTATQNPRWLGQAPEFHIKDAIS